MVVAIIMESKLRMPYIRPILIIITYISEKWLVTGCECLIRWL